MSVAVVFIFVVNLLSLNVDEGKGEEFLHHRHHSSLQIDGDGDGDEDEGNDPLRILYMVTSSKEFEQGKNRLMNTLVPVLQESAQSLLDHGYRVDIYLILGYKFSKQDENEKMSKIKSLLPNSVGLEIWQDAQALFKIRPHHQRVKQVPKSLARQHRYVLRDKLFDYDIFLAMEDDMLVKGDHVDYYIKQTRLLQQLALNATGHSSSTTTHHHGLTKKQLARLRPGFLRVEVIQDPIKYPTQKILDAVPVSNCSLDATPCCQRKRMSSSSLLLSSDRLMIWETSVAAMKVRYIPDIGWVALLHGPSEVPPDEEIPGAFVPPFELDRKPHSLHDPQFAAQSGGWIMTKRQVMEAILSCQGGFVPPFEKAYFPYDGLHGYQSTVEFFSGGMELWQKESGCNLQRYVVLDDFSRHLLYHTANNKQQSIPQERRIKAEVLLGQLYTIQQLTGKQGGHGS